MRESLARSLIKGDKEAYMKLLLLACASLSILGILLIFLFITRESIPAFVHIGFKNMFLSAHWSPITGHFGMVGFIVGTLFTTVIAIVISAPLGIGTALYIDQIAPEWLRTPVRRGVELLAGIPSIVIGWFGLITLVPIVARITNTSGYGILTASLVLVVMALPTITTLSAETLKSIPQELKEGSAAMGATRWQTMYRVMLPAAREGLMVATILGMGRAIGETMAVQMVIGGARQLTVNPFQPTSTLTTRILTEMGEATGDWRSALFAMALVLLLLSMILIISIRLVSRQRRVAA